MSGFDRKEPVLLEPDIAVYRVPARDFPPQEIRAGLPGMKPFASLDAETWMRLFAMLAYTRKEILTKHEVVFYNKQIPIVAERLKSAAAAAGSTNRLLVIVRNETGRTVFNRVDRTSMLIWMDQAGLNIAFGDIREEIPDRTDSMDRNDWAQIPAIDLARSGDDLFLDESPYYQFQKVDGKLNRTWIVVPESKLSSLPPIVPDAEPEKDPQPANANRTLEEKLTTLKQAFQDGIITKEEYEARKKKLLENY